MAGIAVAITSESVLNLKQSCQVLINRYKQYATSISGDDENGIFPILLTEVKGLKVDIEAGCDSLANYERLSLDDVERPKNPAGKLDTFRDIDKITGNYELSQSVYDEAQDEVNKIFKGMKQNEPQREEGGLGSNLNNQGFINQNTTPTPQATPTTPLGEQINPGEGQDPSIKTLEGGISVLAPPPISSGGQTASYQNKAAGKYKGSLLEQCIPCGGRPNGLSNFSADLSVLDPWEELLKKYAELKALFDSLLNNTDIIDDICNLLNFLDFQCLPDLYGLTALLLALIQKYTQGLGSIEGAFLSFIGPLFSPMLSGLNELLDKYIQMILGPIDCVIHSLDTQLAKLDVQRALNQADVQEISFHRKREGYLRRKMEGLQERKAFLTDQLKQGADPNRTPPRKIGGTPRSSQSNVLRDLLEDEPNTGQAPAAELSLPDTALTTTISEEIQNLDEQYKDTKSDYDKEYGPSGENNIGELLQKSRAPNKSVIGDTRGKLSDVRTGLASSLYELRSQIVNGKNMVNDTARMVQEELTRFILGRAATSEEMIEGARSIQKIARLIGILRNLSNLKAIANNPKLCENSNGDPSVALGSFLTANRGVQPENNYYNVYVGTNDNGDESLLVAPSDAVLELTDPETNTVTQVGNLNEINKLNNEGIPKNLGSIANKKITATVPELGTQVPVSIVAFDLCKNSNYSNQNTIDQIRQWATDAGLSA